MLRLLRLSVLCLMLSLLKASYVRGAEELEENLLFTFVQFSDIHSQMKNLKTAVEEVNRLRPAFVVITGDLVEQGLKEEYADFREVISRLRVPWYAVPGNHETIKGTWNDYEAYLEKPLYCSFEYENCQFILLNGGGTKESI